MTPTQRAAMEQALDCLEQLQGGCTDSDDGTVEAITVWCPEIVDALRAALAEQPAEQAYPLPDDLYPDSKDWVHGTYADRVEWLHTMYESAKRLNAALAEQPAEQPVAELDFYVDENGPCLAFTPKWFGHLSNGKHSLYTAPQPAIPPGYKLVPVEPTPEMLRAAWNYHDSERYKCENLSDDVTDAECYRATLAAAPEAPQPAKRVQLTDDEWFEFWDNCQAIPGDSGFPEFLQIARAIEAAHGITGETK